MSCSRRNFMFLAGAGLPMAAATADGKNPFAKLAEHPASITVFTENGELPLVREGREWRSGSVAVETSPDSTAVIRLSSPQEAVLRIRLRWRLAVSSKLLFLGDQWERSYGDLGWRSMEPERILPWYFLATDGTFTACCGVRTGSAAFSFWQLDPAGVSLWLDVRNGGSGVELSERKLDAASICLSFQRQGSAFSAAQQFCRELCRLPRLPKMPIYGGNNWYYAYGHSSATDILADSERMASVAPAGENRPFMVIDDGWQPNPTAGPWSQGNAKFPDMTSLAAQMVQKGVQPGLWIRPLFTKEKVEQGWRLNHPNAAKEYGRNSAYTLDPTVPEALGKIRNDIETVVRWGYRLVKHDFSTYDLFGRWGFAMGSEITDPGWHFADQSKTNAEIVRELYSAIREGARDALVLGCNTVGHLAAGLFELQRIGDDTSGRDWNRTRKMGVNTLAFRASQHGSFFAIDADCVGLTKEVPWRFNRQWLELLAFSGTPLFVSAAPDALGTEQRDALRQAFTLASLPRATAEPLDWLHNTEPARWANGHERKSFDWFGENGASPFSR